MRNLLAWLQSLFWKEEMELTLVGLQVDWSGHRFFGLENHSREKQKTCSNMTRLFCSMPGKPPLSMLLLLASSMRYYITIYLLFMFKGWFQDMIPTVGFNMRKITKGRVTIKLWDIGGQPRWYFAKKKIIF